MCIRDRGYGDTPSRILNYLAQRSESPINVISLTGGVNYYLPNTESNVFNARLHLIPCPLILSSSFIMEELKKETAIQRISKMALISDFTVVGIGGVDTNATIIKNSILTPDDYLLLKKQGAVGDILSHFIDINGNLIDTDLEKRLMSPALTDIEKYNNVVGVAGGPHKIEAIYAVLTGKYLDVLITDENTATAVLEDVYKRQRLCCCRLCLHCHFHHIQLKGKIPLPQLIMLIKSFSSLHFLLNMCDMYV